MSNMVMHGHVKKTEHGTETWQDGSEYNLIKFDTIQWGIYDG